MHASISKQEYSVMGLKVQEARAVLKRGEEIIRPYLNRVKVVQDFLRTQLNTHEEIAENIADIGAKKQAKFNELEREATAREQLEQRRRDEESAAQKAKQLKEESQQKAAEEKDRKVKEIKRQLKDKEITKFVYARLLREAGANEEAALAQAEVEADNVKNNPTYHTVLPNKTTVAGQRARAPLVYEIVDIHKIPRELLYPNQREDGTWDLSKFPRLNQMVSKAPSEAAAEAEAGGGIKCRREDRV